MRSRGTIMLESGPLDVSVHDVEGSVAVAYDHFGSPYRVNVADLDVTLHNTRSTNADKLAQLIIRLVGHKVATADFVIAAVMERIEIVCDKPEAFGIHESDVPQLESLHDDLCELSSEWMCGTDEAVS